MYIMSWIEFYISFIAVSFALVYSPTILKLGFASSARTEFNNYGGRPCLFVLEYSLNILLTEGVW